MMANYHEANLRCLSSLDKDVANRIADLDRRFRASYTKVKAAVNLRISAENKSDL
jgi:hypothetical protein